LLLLGGKAIYGYQLVCGHHCHLGERCWIGTGRTTWVLACLDGTLDLDLCGDSVSAFLSCCTHLRCILLPRSLVVDVLLGVFVAASGSIAASGKASRMGWDWASSMEVRCWMLWIGWMGGWYSGSWEVFSVGGLRWAVSLGSGAATPQPEASIGCVLDLLHECYECRHLCCWDFVC
jgi:hypothetical protein